MREYWVKFDVFTLAEDEATAIKDAKTMICSGHVKPKVTFRAIGVAEPCRACGLVHKSPGDCQKGTGQ